MDHHYRDLRADEVVMAFTLLLSTTVIVMSQHVTLFPASGAPVTTVTFSEIPAGNAGAPDGASTPANPALSRSAAQSAVKADDDFVALPAAGIEALDSDFALAQLARADADESRDPAGAIRIEKNIYVGGKRAGRLEIMVSPDGDLLVQGSELQTLLTRSDFASEAMLARGLGNGRLSFRDLREAGIDFRYSPEDDSFRIVG